MLLLARPKASDHLPQHLKKLLTAGFVLNKLVRVDGFYYPISNSKPLRGKACELQSGRCHGTLP